ncbi:MAG: hypothetical protein JO036_07670 [Candidatus Eremiobacteraeota bacterium]|nr:hypothetical protein [Candidatus Eremiobacteraeota bacterium]
MSYRVLMQRTWKEERTYYDVEGVIYHYPRPYFDLLSGFERFVYYRPSSGAAKEERSAYVGYGTLGQPYADPTNAERRFVDVRQYSPIRPVPYADAGGVFFESGFTSRNAFQGRSIRPISEVDFIRILVAAGIYGNPFESLADTESVVAQPYSYLAASHDLPTQPLRRIDEIPPGTGYRPTGSAIDVQEAAALQERARKDHQDTLQAIQKLVHERGGVTYLNNNVDLLADVRGDKLLVEAKSIGTENVVVDRMRYGIGQLADYSVRYRKDIGDAQRVLAFGRMPSPANRWIGTILQESKIAFVALNRSTDRVVPLNERAHDLPFFSAP